MRKSQPDRWKKKTVLASPKARAGGSLTALEPLLLFGGYSGECLADVRLGCDVQVEWLVGVDWVCGSERCDML